MQSSGDTRRGAQPGNLRVRRSRRTSQEITIRRVEIRRPRRPGVLLLIAGFLFLILAGTALLMLPIASESRQGASFMQALFTATSAVCVTGLAVMDTRESWSLFGEIVILALIQLGGLGFMTSATLLLLLLRRRVSMSQQITTGDAAGQFGAVSVPALVRRIILATLGIEAVGVVFMVAAFAIADGQLGTNQWWRGMFTAVSAFNNAGFDIEGGGTSLIRHAGNPMILGGAAVLTFLGGVGYAVWWDVWRTRGWQRLQLNTKIVLATSAALIAAGAAVIMGNEALTPGMLEQEPLAKAFLISVAESVYARTSGFTAMDLSLVHDETALAIIALMFIGGASGSTAGGIKVNTFTVLWVTIVASVRGEEHVHAYGREVSWRQVNRALSVALLSLAVVAGGSFLLAVTTNTSLVRVMFEVVSAFATCGLSMNLTSELNDMSRGIVIALMFIGRLGPLTFAFALAERFQRRERLRYAEAEISIG